MNGVWTCDLTLLTGDQVQRFWSEDQPQGHATPRIGEFTESNAIAFFQRCGELGLNALVIASIPKDVREDFYAGKCFMVKLGQDRVGFINPQKVFQNSKKKPK